MFPEVRNFCASLKRGILKGQFFREGWEALGGFLSDLLSPILTEKARVMWEQNSTLMPTAITCNMVVSSQYANI